MLPHSIHVGHLFACSFDSIFLPCVQVRVNTYHPPVLKVESNFTVNRVGFLVKGGDRIKLITEEKRTEFFFLEGI